MLRWKTDSAIKSDLILGDLALMEIFLSLGQLICWMKRRGRLMSGGVCQESLGAFLMVHLSGRIKKKKRMRPFCQAYLSACHWKLKRNTANSWALKKRSTGQKTMGLKINPIVFLYPASGMGAIEKVKVPNKRHLQGWQIHIKTCREAAALSLLAEF